MINTFLDVADDSGLRELVEHELESAREQFRRDKPLFVYESPSAEVEVYENERNLSDFFNPFRRNMPYTVRVSTSYLSEDSFFGAEESDLTVLTSRLSAEVEEKESYRLKILQDLYK